MPDFSMPKITKGLRLGTDERTSAWVAFPHLQRLYLLPVIKRQRKIVPVFGDDGEVKVTTEEPNPELGKLVDNFVLATAKAGQNISFTTEAFADFMRLVRQLILTNYEMADADLIDLLSMTERDLSTFYSTLFIHCTNA